MTNRMHEDEPPGYPLSFKIRPAESPSGGLKLISVFSMALILSVIGAVFFMGLVGTVLWVRDGGAPPSLSSNAIETEKQSALPRYELPSPAVRGASAQVVPPSQTSARSQAAPRPQTATRAPNVKPPAAATATKTSAARKGAASATSRASPTPTRASTLTPLPTVPPKGTPPRTPTATRRPPTPYPTGGPPPPPGTCILGCD